MATQGCAISKSTAARVHLSKAIPPGVKAPCSGPPPLPRCQSLRQAQNAMRTSNPVRKASTPAR